VILSVRIYMFIMILIFSAFFFILIPISRVRHSPHYEYRKNASMYFGTDFLIYSFIFLYTYAMPPSYFDVIVAIWFAPSSLFWAIIGYRKYYDKNGDYIGKD